MERRRKRPYIVEMKTTEGMISERFPTYEQAIERMERVPRELIVGHAFLFQELPDGSFRVIREDGKPLQAHRIIDEVIEEEPVPLVEDQPLGKPIKVREPEPMDNRACNARRFLSRQKALMPF